MYSMMLDLLLLLLVVLGIYSIPVIALLHMNYLESPPERVDTVINSYTEHSVYEQKKGQSFQKIRK